MKYGCFRLSATTKCPYCGIINDVLIGRDSLMNDYKNLGRFTKANCDADMGGCDEWYEIKWDIKVSSTSRKRQD